MCKTMTEKFNRMHLIENEYTFTESLAFLFCGFTKFFISVLVSNGVWAT